MPARPLVLIAILAAAPAVAHAQVYESQQHTFRVTTVTDGLEHPWAVAFLPDGRLLITERPGRLQLVEPDTGERTRVRGVPEVAARGQGGLLDVILHPDYDDNGWLYLSYAAAGDGGAATHVSRARLGDGRLQDRQELLVATPFMDSSKHFGSRMAFDEQGYLYVTSGERGRRDQAQRLDGHLGKVIRLTDDGQIPADNPFLDHPEARPGLYTTGHRNPQGMARHPETGAIWIHEHGPRGGDEINILEAGENYGWPETTFGREYYGPEIAPDPPVAGYVSPIHHWTPSIAPSGMAFYTGDAFPQWQGDLFVGALAHTHLRRVVLDGDEVVAEEELLDERGQRIRDVAQGPDGLLYVLVDAADAPLLRLEPVDE
ncbi:PQQ-dependent sugar dehydrogenase [Aquisalimonas lutea]|uniref:PQQ-dependent sugar dehydrogenase n=1 Tax=Aquisalimonas lutea TaxID=1327750 RepID=UPI0025B5307D|nr:PQQ-dependent sugar dehydrogenase [Aquisalimonas lutea]MDN3517299.1 PQQ-dependent sugar dehydrogenase [Aquisalimonas lutea]